MSNGIKLKLNVNLSFSGQIFVPPKMTQKMPEISPAQFRGGGGQVTVVNSQKNHAAVEKQVNMKTL